MPTSFWCSTCKIDHAGDCPPPSVPADKYPPGYEIVLKPGALAKPAPPKSNWTAVLAIVQAMSDYDVQQLLNIASDEQLRRMRPTP